MPLPLIPIIAIGVGSFLAGLGGKRVFNALKIKLRSGENIRVQVTLNDDSYFAGRLHRLGEKSLTLELSPSHYRDVALGDIKSTVVVPS